MPLEKNELISNMSQRIRDHETQYSSDQLKIKEMLLELASLKSNEIQRISAYEVKFTELAKVNDHLKIENESRMELFKMLRDLLCRKGVEVGQDALTLHARLEEYISEVDNATKYSNAALKTVSAELSGGITTET